MISWPSPIVILTFLSGVATAGVAGYIWRQSDKRGAKMLVVVLVGATLWSAGYAMALSTFDPALNRTFEAVAWLGRIMMPTAWLVFAIQYTGRESVLTKPVIGILTLNPGITLGVLAIPTLHQLMWQDYRVVEILGAAVGIYGNGPWLVWQTIYGYVLIGGGLFVLLDVQYSEGRLYRGQMLALILAAVVPASANVVWLLDLGPVSSLDLTPVTFSVTGFVMAYALFRQDLFGLVPATGREGKQIALDHLGDGIVVIDEERRVIDLNATAREVLAPGSCSPRGEPIETIIPDPSADQISNGALVDVDGRTYELKTTPIHDPRRRKIGWTILFHDVTEQVRRKQQLSVLNRVLRHNLRNEMTVIHGYAEMLNGNVGGAQAEFIEVIEERSQALLKLAERARNLEQVIMDTPGDESHCSLDEVLWSTAERVAASYPDGEVVVNAPESVRTELNDELIETAVANLIENGMVHNDSPEPTVEVTLSRNEESVEISVADNGPGIPDWELDVIRSDSETPLEHSSGLGLWLVTWCVSAMGGTVEFGHNDPRGTVVLITLPDGRVDPWSYEPVVA